MRLQKKKASPSASIKSFPYLNNCWKGLGFYLGKYGTCYKYNKTRTTIKQNIPSLAAV